MKIIIIILNIILFVISIGAFSKERERYPDWNPAPIGLDILANVALVISIIFEVKLLHKINDFSWYWNLIISLILIVLSTSLHLIYTLPFGYKSNHYRIGSTQKVNDFLMDGLITFVLGLIVYFLYCNTI